MTNRCDFCLKKIRNEALPQTRFDSPSSGHLITLGNCNRYASTKLLFSLNISIIQ